MTNRKFVNKYSKPIIFLIFLAIIFTTVTPSSASTSRIISLGGIGDYIEDDHNTLRWAGSLIDYPNTVTLTSGPFTIDGYYQIQDVVTSGPGALLHFSPGEGNRFGTAALYLHGNYSIGNPGSLINDDLFLGGTTFMYGRSIGPVQATATYFTQSGTIEDFSIFRTSESANKNFGLGLRFDISENAYADIATEIKKFSLNQSWVFAPISERIREEESWNNYNIRGRFFINLGHQLALVPLLEYLHQDSPADSEISAFRSNLNGHSWRYGCGLNFFPDSDNLLFLSLDYVNCRQEDRLAETDQETYSFVNHIDWDTFETNLGLESRFQPWLTLRAALGYKCLSSEEKSVGGFVDGNTPVSNYDDSINISAGLGIQLYSFDLDLALSTKEPARNPFGTGPVQLHGDLDNQWLSVTLRYGF